MRADQFECFFVFCSVHWKVPRVSEPGQVVEDPEHDAHEPEEQVEREEIIECSRDNLAEGKGD